MKYLLSPPSTDVLYGLTRTRALLAFDYDGTLAPIVASRDDAQMRPETAALFGRVCELFPCAVISGRSQADVAARLRGAPVKYVVGNHGAEPSGGLERFAADVARAREWLREALAEQEGIEIEDKSYSLAVHYRRADDPVAAAAAIAAAVSKLPASMRVVDGKRVVNVVAERAPNKGDALLDLRALEHADTVLYVGDDVTDEDVFELNQPGRVIGVRVGESQSSAAQYFLRDQLEMDELLRTLVLHAEAHAPR